MKFKKIPTFYQNYFRQHKISLIFFTAVLIVQSLLLVVLPLPLKEIINNLDNKPYFLKMLVCIFVLSVTSLGFSYLENIMLVKQKRQLQMMIRDYLFKKILSQTYAYHLKKQKMLMVNNLNKDVVHVEDLFTKTMVAAVRSLPSVFLLLSALVFIEPQIGLFIILLLPLYFYFGKMISKNFRILDVCISIERDGKPFFSSFFD
jgi:ABC-type multidrug transport system fused ATPase/permease subunit